MPGSGRSWVSVSPGSLVQAPTFYGDVMKLEVALRKAAEYRTDVRRFDIGATGQWSATFYRGQEAPIQSGHINFADLSPDDSMIDILERAMNKPYPTIHGKRPQAWHDACERAFFRTVKETEHAGTGD